ncbi:MAG: hypothetical protein C6P37_04215 [Caldibacillus debilis]|uniref:Uncharacterized protein n=1 Tax=Caldibacillus debilis TaxID=301148 RepID=A0A3E0K6M2_9BACI|nr:MAG: hypothetical protein BAA03_00170 [Caldibacillus debilis]REJ14847.1 MAG: hypothetical protein C6W57_13080 [Caldibacillus debilis]REJ29153.1 MAG: hypothetical protein C6W56_06885 [Caldibacillus debilis]REJ30003.1 MAG: hypothetical protein C6P37_04215 [Caldibacillus debilis]
MLLLIIIQMGLKNRQFFKKAAVLSACRDGSFHGRSTCRFPPANFIFQPADKKSRLKVIVE